ncbi:hypothetical protein A0H81_00661 [Grifola frondosa]|uniref:Uncharacterized protein n=1 Tax=Grifola frondosa TaxID=5627 RepID=A0A1C7MPV3_GRIFR|nr:hypothetical protein A0H81_00661 [Grifola frondosa]
MKSDCTANLFSSPQLAVRTVEPSAPWPGHFCAFIFNPYPAAALAIIRSLTLVNGQVFTNGLAVVDSPQPNTPLNAGSNMPIAIDVSGDGRLDTTSGIDLLELYMVSSETLQNITVSAGPELLIQESGSTVKHLNWPIPDCIPAGDYNLTFYENSHAQGNNFFSITPIPVELQNSAPSDACTSAVNDLQDQPQPSSPPPSNLLPINNAPQSTDSPLSTITSAQGVITVTAGASGIVIEPSSLPATIVIEPSGGAPTSTSSGFTTINASRRDNGVHYNRDNSIYDRRGSDARELWVRGFLPVNAASWHSAKIPVLLIWTLCTCLFNIHLVAYV